MPVDHPTALRAMAAATSTSTGAEPRAPQVGSSGERQRRLRPRLWDTDWLVLRKMRDVIDGLAGDVASPRGVVIDFGCGGKPYAQLFESRGMTYLGADLDGVSELAIRTDGTLAAADRSADVVVSFQVLEHVRDLDTYLGEAGRVLREEGLLLLSTHGTWLYHPHPEDHRRWTREGLLAELAGRGFEVTTCVAVVGPLAWTTIVRLTCFAYVLRRIPVFGGALAAGVAIVLNLKAAVEDRITPQWVTRDNACVYVTLSRRPREATA